MWSVGGRFVAIADRLMTQTDIESTVLTSFDGRTWMAGSAPIEKLAIRAGVVEFGVLTVVGRSRSLDEPAWQSWSTSDGSTWTSGVTLEGLDDVVEVRHLGRGSGKWVAAVSVHRPGHDGYVTGDELRYSDDGEEWHPAAAESLDELATIQGIASNELRTIVVTNEPTGDGTTQVRAWSSEAGVVWRPADIATLVGGASAVTSPAMYEVEAGRFVVVGWEADQGIEHPRAWASYTGSNWEAAEIESGDRAPSGIVAVAFSRAVTVQSYVAIGRWGNSWISSDGSRWMAVPILAPGVHDTIRAVAINDTVVAVGGASPVGPRIWLGNLVLMRHG